MQIQFVLLISLLGSQSWAQYAETEDRIPVEKVKLTESDIQELEEQTKTEFNIKKQQLEKRYEDFYIHFNDKERRDYERRAAAGAHTKERQDMLDEYEQARIDFVKNRKKKPARDNSSHLKELAEQAMRKERSRKIYVQRRNRLMKLREGVKKIPEEKEVGLDYEEMEQAHEKSKGN